MSYFHDGVLQEEKQFYIKVHCIFDHVSWPFLLKTLNKFGFGPNFIKWIQLLYTAPQSVVRVNECISQAFELGRGTRQGCPLSPLLFALSIEPLAQMIREDVNIKRYRNWQWNS